MHKYFYLFTPNTKCALVVALSEKKQVPFSMAIRNVELMQECFTKHLRMGTARMESDEETQKQVRIEAWEWKKVTKAREKKSHDGLNY